LCRSGETLKRILHVVGARPNFMKMAPILREMAQRPAEFEQILVHTGQHYDASMSQVFFDELELPQPDVNLEVGSGSHAQQTALIHTVYFPVMQRFEPVVLDYRPDWVVVPGDVNSAVVCALVANKLGVKLTIDMDSRKVDALNCDESHGQDTSGDHLRSDTAEQDLRPGRALSSAAGGVTKGDAFREHGIC